MPLLGALVDTSTNNHSLFEGRQLLWALNVNNNILSFTKSETLKRMLHGTVKLCGRIAALCNIFMQICW